MNEKPKSVPQPPESQQPAVPPAGPSVDVNHQPVAENDNSANLFEDHISNEKKEAK
jgi:hypothetical protein